MNPPTANSCVSLPNRVNAAPHLPNMKPVATCSTANWLCCPMRRQLRWQSRFARGSWRELTRWQGDTVTFTPEHSYTPSPHHLVTLSPLHNLPPQPTPFMGRSAELTQIIRLLTNPDCRLMTLLGVGGRGKTRLAIEATQRIIEGSSAGDNRLFCDGACFVSLAPVEAIELLIVTITRPKPDCRPIAVHLAARCG